MLRRPRAARYWLALVVLALMLLGAQHAALADKCANVCTCRWKGGKRTVECRGRSLASVPEGIDPETQVLDASDNEIGALPNRVFVKVRLTNLQRLYLRNCRIARIDPEALEGLTNLVELDLSHNALAGVPSDSLARTPYLRDLSLAHNPLAKVGAHAFKEMPNLIKLDLSHAQLSELAAKGFQGLEALGSLKLQHNRIATLHPGTFEPLGRLTSIELHDNPWVCDCHLREMKGWLVKQNLPTLVAPVCHGPEALANRSFAELGFDDFACRPVMLIVSRYAEATIGENASIVCTVTAIPPARIKWIWNGRLYTNHSAVNSYQRILIYEEGSFRKRSTLVLTNAQETDSSNFFCVAENPAGSVEANFTLHVSLRTAGMSTLGSGQIAGISAALVVLILVILLTIVVLFVRLRRTPRKDDKSPAPDAPPSQPGQDGCRGDAITRDPVATGGAQPAVGAATLARRQAIEEPEPPTAPVANHLGTYEPRFDYLAGRGYEDAAALGVLVEGALPQQRQRVLSGSCYPAQTSPPHADNPDLIRDTRRGSADEVGLPPVVYGVSGTYGHLLDVNASRLLYTECLAWEAHEPAASLGSFTADELQLAQMVGLPQCAPPPPAPQHPQAQLLQQHTANGQQHQQHQQQQQESFPPGAKQMRVWQKGVPVLPPVSALKRVLGSTRSSPDEGYQEGTGTDV